MTCSPYRLSARFRKIIKEQEFSESFGLHHLSLELRQDHSKRCARQIEQELYHLQIHQNEILRRQSDLAYLLEDLWLEEQAGRVRSELGSVTNRRNAKTTPERRIEARLAEALVKIVDERDQLLLDLEVERLREREEDMELWLELQAKHQQWSAMQSPSTTYDSIAQSERSTAGNKWLHSATNTLRRLLTARFWNDMLERINSL